MEIPAPRRGAFGDLLRACRTAAGLTQEELSERSGLSVRAIANLERGRTDRPYRRSVSVLADALILVGRTRDEFEAAARRSGPGDMAVIPPDAAGSFAPAPAVAAVAVPRQLPGPVRHFVGRTAELAALTTLLGQAGAQAPGMVVISAIDGTAGVGKTALALHWAYSAADRFPDGQLYTNLRGYDPGQPMSAHDALGAFLRALGVSGQDIPAETDERAARYRSLLAGRRVLVVLDNASEVDQVRPLLPGTPTCVTVVTSRDSLAGLVARDGAQRLDLDLLPPAEAIGLLRALIGDRVDGDPDAAEMLAGRCCRLPLALRVAAELAIARPAVPLSELAGELAGQQRLDRLDAAGDARTAVRSVFSWSYRQLPRDAARAFRLVGLDPSPDLDRYAAAALTDDTLALADRMLDQLARAHLIQGVGSHRYVMHDLLRDFARELAAAEDGTDGSRTALTRLFDYQLHATATAMDTLFPAERHRRPRVPLAATPVPPFTDPDSAQAWLDAQRPALAAAAVYTAANGWPAHTIGLARTLTRYLDVGGHYGEAAVAASCARRVASAIGDYVAEAEALLVLGTVEWHQGRLRPATAHYEQAVVLSRQAGDRALEGRAVHSLGIADLRQGRYEQALKHNRQALAIYRETADRTGESRTLHNLALVDLQHGRYQQASDHLQQALTVFRDDGDRAGQAHVLSSLGAVEVQWGRYDEAAAHLQLSLVLNREISNRSGESYVLSSLGLLSLRQGRHQQAFRQLEQALTQCREIGDRTVETEALNNLGEVLLASRQPARARATLEQALVLASQIGDHYEQARAHDGLALAHQAAADTGQARRHWQLALALYTELGSPAAAQVRAQLASD
jgi:tetratricopeptide (TPR) repeat protein